MSRASDETLPPRRGRLFWITAALGWAVIGWGLRGALIHHIDTRPDELARYFIGSALVHDLLFAPVYVSPAVYARPFVERLPGLVNSRGTLVLFAYPEVRGFAHALHNPTSLPHNYAANLALVLALVVAGIAVGTAVTRVRRGRSRRHS